MSSTPYSVQLNNYFQNIGQSHLLACTDNNFANRVWALTYTYQGQVLGTGQGATKPEARENAAKASLQSLRVI